MILILGNILTHVILILGNIYWLLGKHTENTLCGQGNVILELICARFNNKVQGEEPKIIGVSINSSVYWFLKKKFPLPPQLFGNSRQFLRKWRQKECFLGTFEHQRRNRYIPIYPDISYPIFSHPHLISYWADAALILPNNQYYPDISISVRFLNR